IARPRRSRVLVQQGSQGTAGAQRLDTPHIRDQPQRQCHGSAHDGREECVGPAEVERVWTCTEDREEPMSPETMELRARIEALEQALAAATNMNRADERR